MKIEMHEYSEINYKVTLSHFQNKNPKGVVLVFPGAGYSHMGPCLYYPSNALFEFGYDIINFEYDFRRERLNDDTEKSYGEFYNFLMSSLKNFNLPQTKIALTKTSCF